MTPQIINHQLSIMKHILTLLFLLTTTLFAFGQVTVLDHEAAATTNTFTYFGNFTLNGAPTNVIANPDMSGINTSSMVGEFIKKDTAQTWAGAYSNPNPMQPIDAVSYGQMCMKVWSATPGTVTLKLENSTSGALNWLQVDTLTATNQWVEVCYNFDDMSLEDSDGMNGLDPPASGSVYNTLVMFYNLGTAGNLATDETYYFDDVVLSGTGSGAPGDVTVAVDMSDYTAAYTDVYISGSWNGWSAGQLMSDPDGDKIYTTTVAAVPPGLMEYKFQLDNWTVQEEFDFTDECIVTDPSGQFHNRFVNVNGNFTADTVCFDFCYTCGNSIDITFRINMKNEVTDPAGVFLAGGLGFGLPGDHPMADPDMDDIWELSFNREKGFWSYFTFLNGNCPDWSCKEDLTGLPCGDAGNFYDRIIGPSQDTIYTTCFGVCAFDTTCLLSSVKNVTLRTDLFELAPSLTQGEINLTFSGLSQSKGEITVINNQGVRALYQVVEANEQRISLDLSHLANGQYFVHYANQDGRQMERFVLLR